MKRIFIISSLLLSSILVFSQNKQDYIWPMGLHWNGGLIIDFNKKPTKIYGRNGDFTTTRTIATISDSLGNLLFYCNGWAIANKNHIVMPDGLGINDGQYFQEYWDADWQLGGLARQDMIVLPDPAEALGYYIIHKIWEFRPDNEEIFSMEKLKYSYVDTGLENGLGNVTEKNVTFFDGNLQAGFLTAISKPDSKDYWILNPSLLDNRYYLWSLTQEGIMLQDSQQIGPLASEERKQTLGDARFSPDGTQYAYFNLHDGLSLFDFDRATGELSNLRRLEWDPLDEFNWAGGIEFSPNSRFIYIVNEYEVHQVDTWEDDLDAGLEFIAEWDGFIDLDRTLFFALALGPDCKLYVRSGSSSSYMHTIHNPDKKGTACNFIQRDVILPNISSAGAFPNVPRFRVDEAEKCDSSITMVNGVNVFWRRDLEVYPSPASEYVTIDLPENKKGAVSISDMHGQVVWQQERLSGQQIVDVCELPAGIYTVDFSA